MKDRPEWLFLPYSRWLVIGALTEWLISRTFTRAAIHIPKTPALITGYQILNTVGQIAAAFTTLLAIIILIWVAWREWQHEGRRVRPLLLVARVCLSLSFLFIIPSNGLIVLHHLLTLAILLTFVLPDPFGKTTTQEPRFAPRIVLWLATSTLFLAVLYQMLPAWYTLLHQPGPSPLTGFLFNLGELLVLLSIASLWWFYGRAAAWSTWLIALFPALFFALLYGRAPAMTGILVIWSTGLSSYLPWFLYAAALWLATVTVLVTWQENPTVALALLLLAAAGYAPQLSSQLFCALIALGWLARPRIPITYPKHHPRIPVPTPNFAPKITP